MKIDKASVMNSKATIGMDTYINKDTSYLNKCVATNRITHFNLSAINKDLENNIKAHSK